MEGARALDPQRTALAELIECLIRHVGIEKEFTAAQLSQRAQETRTYLKIV
jgi:hypothetical protein